MIGPYARWIADYRRNGLRPFPVEGKRPCITNYAARAPSLPTLERWAERFPRANLGIPTRRNGLAVLDADDDEALAIFDAIAGPPAARVLTSRGEHWYFTDPQNEIAGVNHPGGQPFDIKAGGAADYVLVPGSSNGETTYQLADYAGSDMAGEFARRLRDLTPLPQTAYLELLKQPSGRTQVVVPGMIRSPSPLVLTGARVREGARNNALFQAACRDAHVIRQRLGDGPHGVAALAAQAAAVNEALLDPPLPDGEVGKLVDGVWRRTLSGVNRAPTRRAGHVREALVRVGRETRAVALWGWLSQGHFDTSDMELSPSRLAGVIPGWKTHDFAAAITRMVAAKILRQLSPGQKGRGLVARYRLLEPLVTQINVGPVLAKLRGDHAAMSLLAFLVDVWGPESDAPISAEGMTLSVGGPFGAWSKPKLLKARDHLEAAGLLLRVQQRRVGVRRARALFQVRAGGVLKMLENVPVDIHRPPLVLARSEDSVRGIRRA